MPVVTRFNVSKWHLWLCPLSRSPAARVDRESDRLNGELNVQSLTEKQAKADLLLEVTGRDISASELAERSGYSSKGGAHNAREKWHQDRDIANAD